MICNTYWYYLERRNKEGERGRIEKKFLPKNFKEIKIFPKVTTPTTRTRTRRSQFLLMASASFNDLNKSSRNGSIICGNLKTRNWCFSCSRWHTMTQTRWRWTTGSSCWVKIIPKNWCNIWEHMIDYWADLIVHLLLQKELHDLKATWCTYGTGSSGSDVPMYPYNCGFEYCFLRRQVWPDV